MKTISALFLFSFFNLTAYAVSSPKVQVTGVVKSWDEKYVTIQGKKHTFKVPRKTLKGKEKLEEGKKLTFEVDNPNL